MDLQIDIFTLSLSLSLMEQSNRDWSFINIPRQGQKRKEKKRKAQFKEYIYEQHKDSI